MSDITKTVLGIFYFLCFLAFGLGPWIQHLYTCFTDDRWGFLIAGALFAPIGWIHGLGLWVGVW